MSAPVRFEERATNNGACLGIATLDVPETLNALSLEMTKLLTAQLSAWAIDPAVTLIFLDGAGDKAFCAGGDLKDLYASMLRHHASSRRQDIRANAYALEFFSREYRLDYLIHTYPKPILCWGHGIVMGGGLGLMAGASHRIVTEKSKIAMPEVNIGLYPDVGGTWLLGRMPGSVGLFLALTGAPLNGADALFTGVADYQIAQSEKDHVMDILLRLQWTDDRQSNEILLADMFQNVSTRASGETMGPVRRNFDLINDLCRQPCLIETIAAIAGLKSHHDSWLTQAAGVLAAGSPSSAALAHALQSHARNLSLAEVFRMELVASLHCAARHDFAEGIRALLIDKDRMPQWLPASHDEVTRDWVDGYFASPWSRVDRPLADLGIDTDS